MCVKLYIFIERCIYGHERFQNVEYKVVAYATIINAKIGTILRTK